MTYAEDDDFEQQYAKEFAIMRTRATEDEPALPQPRKRALVKATKQSPRPRSNYFDGGSLHLSTLSSDLNDNDDVQAADDDVLQNLPPKHLVHASRPSVQHTSSKLDSELFEGDSEGDISQASPIYEHKFGETDRIQSSDNDSKLMAGRKRSETRVLDTIREKENLSPLFYASGDRHKKRKINNEADDMALDDAASQEAMTKQTMSPDPRLSPTPHAMEDMSVLQRQLEGSSKQDYSQMPETGAFQHAVSSTGKPFYFPKVVKSKSPTSTISLPNHSTPRGYNQRFPSLLEKPIPHLIELLRLERISNSDRAIAEIEAMSEHTLTLGDGKNNTNLRLWTEKYRPRSFLDLQGDERLNREVLSWVKCWDQCVFGDDRFNQQRQTTSHRGRVQQTRDVDGNVADPWGRPDRKILLLTGPPGVGKTTIAHIAAAHAGYHTIEINASDDRTGEIVKSKITAATQMQAIVTGDDRKGETVQKPSLLIIDEIDGVSAGGGADSFINLLTDLVTAGKSGTVKKGRKKRGPHRPLLRPIICICNDQFAPVLRPLRQIAHILNFRKTTNNHISKHLLRICELEGLTTDLRTLSSLTERSGGDLRSCLNSLQFVRNRTTQLTPEMLLDESLGRKDVGKSIFAHMEEIFFKETTRAKHAGGLTKLKDSIEDFGDFGKLIQGCFENYPQLEFRDYACEKLVLIGDWLDFYERVDHRVSNLHIHELYGYLPYAIVNFHRFFAASIRQEHRMEFPKTDYENYMLQKQNERLLSIFQMGMAPHLRRTLTARRLTTEFLSPLLRIISPNLKPINRQLIKPQEKTILVRVVHLMLSTGLSFVQEQSEDSQYLYRMEPPIDTLIMFRSMANKPTLANKYAVRQLISREIELELLRRQEEAADRKVGLAKNADRKAYPHRHVDLDLAKQGIKKTEEKPPVDFFGRPVVQNHSTEKISGGSRKAQTIISPIRYKYNEGFSNAYFLPHLTNGWQVDQAILAEEDRVVVIRFGHDYNPECMKMDETLYGIAEKVKNFAVIYLVDITEVPDFNKMYELYDECTVMFFFRNKHMMVDLGTGNNNKINWALEDKQELIDIIEVVYRGARKGRGLVVSPKDYSTKYKY
ncbi:hypothetical protein BZG36_01437 [Bifiguratus adelaidae]|uniref:AAA+ ATPase domain-containing protein n=1 Tax=Bifiguratus adelaidae TaxID=1938954 RepID=A0A261Y505_9FUNG|nr:hypothetical protein BZG36_01437 [Bifiguratus adelaidae]